ncbi:MAG: ABC transporter substrate-binding protein [Chloroflexi bacterium]|nr:ABC transporter substrate-binding protein [Chloroflexota bacterium]
MTERNLKALLGHRTIFFGLILLFILVISGCQRAANDEDAIVSTTTLAVPPTAEPLRVLVLTPEQYAYGGGTLVEELIEAAGAENAASSLEPYNQIADHQIIALMPDVILFSQAWTSEGISAWSRAEVYSDLPAVTNDRLYHLDFSLADAPLEAHWEARVELIHSLLTGLP